MRATFLFVNLRSMRPANKWEVGVAGDTIAAWLSFPGCCDHRDAGSFSKLTGHALHAALSLGGDVIAVSVHPEPSRAPPSPQHGSAGIPVRGWTPSRAETSAGGAPEASDTCTVAGGQLKS